MMHDEQLRPVLDRLLATRRAKVEDTQSGQRKGLRVLFTGHSGKNKLLAAQLFAHELSVDLFQIDRERSLMRSSGACVEQPTLLLRQPRSMCWR